MTATAFEHIKMPAIESRFILKFVETSTGEELTNLSLRVTKVRDGRSELSVAVEVDEGLQAIKDIAKLKANAKDYVALICVMSSNGDLASAFAYENIKVSGDPLHNMTWDYANHNTQNLEVIVTYETRRIITSDAIGPLVYMLKPPA